MSAERKAISDAGTIAVASIVWVLQGCSLAFVSGPPSGHESMRDFACTEDGAGPAADTAFAISSGLAAAVSAESNDDGSRTATIVNIGATVVYAASAAYGVVMTYDCRGAQRAARTRRAQEHASQTERIKELEAALVGARCETSSDCRSDRVCNEHRCVVVPPPPNTGTNPDTLQMLETSPQPPTETSPQPPTEIPPPPPADTTPADAIPPAPDALPPVPPATSPN